MGITRWGYGFPFFFFLLRTCTSRDTWTFCVSWEPVEWLLAVEGTTGSPQGVVRRGWYFVIGLNSPSVGAQMRELPRGKRRKEGEPTVVLFTRQHKQWVPIGRLISLLSVASCMVFASGGGGYIWLFAWVISHSGYLSCGLEPKVIQRCTRTRARGLPGVASKKTSAQRRNNG